MKFLRRIQHVMGVLSGERRSSFDDVQLQAIDRPEPGRRVVCVQDEGPPGLEHVHGWMGLEGRVVAHPEAEKRGGIAVMQAVESLPFPRELLDNADVTEVFFIWDRSSWKEVR